VTPGGAGCQKTDDRSQKEFAASLMVEKPLTRPLATLFRWERGYKTTLLLGEKVPGGRMRGSCKPQAAGFKPQTHE